MYRLDFQTALKESFDIEGISQSELSRRSGVSQQAISKYIKAEVRQPRLEYMEALAKALHFSTLKAMIAYGREKRTGEITSNVEGDKTMRDRLLHCEQRIKDLEKIIRLYENGEANP